MNKEALKMVGPGFEESKADTKGAEVSLNSISTLPPTSSVNITPIIRLTLHLF